MTPRGLITIIKFNLLAGDLFGFWVAGNFVYYWYTGDLAQDLLFTPSMILLVSFLILILHIFNNYTPLDRDLGLILPFRYIFSYGIAIAAISAVIFISPFRYEGGIWGRGNLFTIFLILLVWGFLIRVFFFFYVKRNMDRIRGKWLIIAGFETAIQIIREIEQRKVDWEARVLVDPRHPLTERQKKQLGDRYLGTWKKTPEFLKESWLGVVLGFNPVLPEKVVQSLMEAKIAGQRIMDLGDFYEDIWEKVPVLHLKDGWLVFSQGFSILHNRINIKIKDIVEYTLSAVLLLLLFPVIFLIALVIKVESRGPVLFKQERTGKNGKIFYVWKFRTMVVGSENQDPYTRKKDMRITGTGKILRVLRLDEIPQLVNVLRGEMSLIGPRAEWTILTEQYEKKLPFYNLRHLVKPGITGWAQVQYPYGSSIEDARQKLEYDLYYIKNYSLLLDFRIVFKTIRVVLFVRGR